jgi:hypothetical protein
MTRSIAPFAVFAAVIAFSLALAPTATHARVFQHARAVRGAYGHDPVAGRTVVRTPVETTAARTGAVARALPPTNTERTGAGGDGQSWDTVYRTDGASAASGRSKAVPHPSLFSRRP